MLAPRLETMPNTKATLLSLIRTTLSLSFQSASCLNCRYRTNAVTSPTTEQKLNRNPKTLLSGCRSAVSLMVGNHDVSFRRKEITYVIANVATERTARRSGRIPSPHRRHMTKSRYRSFEWMFDSADKLKLRK